MKDRVFGSFLATASPTGGFVLSMQHVETGLRLLSLLVGIVGGCIGIWLMLRNKDKAK